MRRYVQKIKQLRKNKYFKICIAESCTGGMISTALTSVSGSSEFFEGAIISYSNYFKNSLLKVPSTVINTYGAVSHETALSMVKGLKRVSNSEIQISVTGVAGPKGGSSKTPVGCVYHYNTIKKNFREKSRKTIQKQSTEFILKEIIKNLNKI